MEQSQGAVTGLLKKILFRESAKPPRLQPLWGRLHTLSVLRGARRRLEAGAVSIVQFAFGPVNIYSRPFFYDFWSLLSPRFDLYRIIPRGTVPITFYGEHREVFLTTNYLAVRRPS